MTGSSTGLASAFSSASAFPAPGLFFLRNGTFSLPLPLAGSFFLAASAVSAAAASFSDAFSETVSASAVFSSSASSSSVAEAVSFSVELEAAAVDSSSDSSVVEAAFSALSSVVAEAVALSPAAAAASGFASSSFDLASETYAPGIGFGDGFSATGRGLTSTGALSYSILTFILAMVLLRVSE